MHLSRANRQVAVAERGHAPESLLDPFELKQHLKNTIVYVMASFEASVFIDAPVERVWAFHERDDVLQLLAPSNVKVLRREGGLKTGAEVEFLIPVGHSLAGPPYGL